MEFKKQQELKELLTGRFFFQKKSGNQNIYFDLVTQTSGLTKQHLVRVLVEYGADYKDSLELIKNDGSYILPITIKKIYRPGGNPVVNDGGPHFLNMWRKPTVEPTDNDPNKFIEHLELALGDTAKVCYLIDLLAHRYQHTELNKKPHIAAYFYGSAQGQGKSMFANTLSNVFGNSAVRIAPSVDKLRSMSVVDLWTRTWLITEETDIKKGSDTYDMIKSYTGMDSTETDRKHSNFDTYEIPAQLIMLSNRSPNFIEPNDRRFFVSEWDTGLRGTEKDNYFNDYAAWLETVGYGAIAGLLSKWEVSSNLFSAALPTEEKQRAMNVAEDEVVLAIKHFLEENGEYDVFTKDDFDEIWSEFDIKAQQRKHKLNEAGLMKCDERLTVGKRSRDFWYRKGEKIIYSQGKAAQIKKMDGLVRDARSYQSRPSEF